jgi:K+-transporting ATPase A subunit
MTANGWLQIALFTLLIALSVRPLGGYMMRVFQGEPTALGRLLGPIEQGIYRLAGIDATVEQRWLDYALALIAFNAAGVATLYALQRLQGVLPFNPQHFSAADPALALNTAISFAWNTSCNPMRKPPPVPDPDGRITVRSPSLCRHRHRGRNRPGARLRAQAQPCDRQFWSI